MSDLPGVKVVAPARDIFADCEDLSKESGMVYRQEARLNWRQDARAALAGLIVDKTISPEEAAARAADFADALEAEAKKRKK